VLGSNCTPAGICEFADEGSACKPNILPSNCRGGLYCKLVGSVGFLCVPLRKEGESCSLADPCDSGLFCAINNTCVRLFSLSEGEACSDSIGEPVGRVPRDSVFYPPGGFGITFASGECAPSLSCVNGTCGTSLLRSRGSVPEVTSFWIFAPISLPLSRSQCLQRGQSVRERDRLRHGLHV
jgi:hypothetical protein